MNVFACDWVSKWSVDGMTLIVLHRFHATELFSGEHAYIYIHIYTTTTAVRERERVCVYVCVCVRERRRRGERENKRD